MIPLLAFAAIATLATRGTVPDLPCAGATTPAVEQCLSERLKDADADLARYLGAARKRLRQDSESDTTARAFEDAEQAWARYRDAECAAVYEFWSAGTIRGAETLTCQIRLSRLHAHTVWRLWLTYPDATPPILPEPAVSPGS